MNLFQGINSAAMFLILGAVVTGLAKRLLDVQDSPTWYLLEHREIAYLAIFIIVFRIKTSLDDHKHFGEMHRDQNVFRYIGFVLAILSWIFWALAGYIVASSTIRASELLAIGILISTSWVAVHLIEILVDRDRRKNEAGTSLMRQKWVLFNIGYMLCLVGYVGWYRPVIKEGTSAMLLFLLAVLLVDMLVSRSFRDVTAA
jgi:hypothetical protein